MIHGKMNRHVDARDEKQYAKKFGK